MNNRTARLLRRYSSAMLQRARLEAVQGDRRRVEPMPTGDGVLSPGIAKLKAWYLSLSDKERGVARKQIQRELRRAQ